MDHNVMESQARPFHDVKLMLEFKPFFKNYWNKENLNKKNNNCTTASTVCVYILFFSWNEKKQQKNIPVWNIMMPLNHFSHLATIPELCS